MEITNEFIKKTIGTKSPNYDECVQLAEKLKVHAEGRTPHELIDIRRPSEPEAIRAYRKSIYVPKTKNPIMKVINSLEKIRRSSDWVIQYPESNKKIREGESLEEYCEKNYPIFDSLTNWMFSEGLKEYLFDSNGIVAVFPEKTDIPNSEFLKPTAHYFDSAQIIDFVDGEYAVILSNDTTQLRTPSGKISKLNGAIYYILTDTHFYKLEQQSGNKDLTQTQEYAHNIGSVPVFKVGGLFRERKNNGTIYESRISSMIPSLDEAAREYSDLQAEILQHIHSEKYAYVNSECKVCNGTGTVLKGDKRVTCETCGGHGSVLNSSPYGMHLISAQSVGEHSLPTPPIGYIQKSTEIAKLQDERVRQHIYDALSTLNMEFLAERPLNQSGVAKEVDRDELNNFVNSIAEDIVRILDKIYLYINEYRNNVVLPNSADRKLLLPSINVPTKFDILSSNYLLQELTAAKTGGISPAIRKSLEVEYAQKKFNTMPEIAEYSELTFKLNPMYGISEDEKMIRLANGGVSAIDYVISCNVEHLVMLAMEDVNFYDKDYKTQTAKINQLATELQKTIGSVAQVIPTNNGFN